MSIEICVRVTNNSAPVNGLADDPEITIVRTDTQAIVAGLAAMVDQGLGGIYTFTYTPTTPDLKYAFNIDADPNVTGQVTAFERFYGGCFDDQLDEVWRDRGLDPAINKTITENTVGEDYTEAELGDGAPITKSVVKAAGVTTINRT
jgi:hypothetical protein